VSERPEAVAPLEATGERLVPELQHGQVVHAEHLVRYRVAGELAGGRRVLDAACGEGYGTALLAAAGARSATGVDLDEVTILHARERHPGPEFLTGDVLELALEADAFDLVVCFETIEHVSDPNRALGELDRVMAPDGLLIVSTPNKHRYLVENEFHEHEFFHEEFVALLRERFERVEVMLQHNWLTSAVLPVPLAADGSGERDHEVEFRKLVGIHPGSELYTLALCGRGELPRLRGAAVAATVDEAHELATRAVQAERTARMWHEEYEKAVSQLRDTRRTLFDLYASVWWRMTRPLRLIADFVRRRRA
jgi:SAM-dependent methyltransferase